MRVPLYVIGLFLLSCHSKEQQFTAHVSEIANEARSDKKAKETVNVARLVGVRSVEDLYDYSWMPRQSDTSRYHCEVQFRKEYALYSFNGQCAYYFFTNTSMAKPQHVEMIWAYKNPCAQALPYLEGSHGISAYPKHGDPFAVYRILNDTTLEVEYHFPEWVKKVNELVKDSLFPHRLYLVQEATAAR